MKINGIIKKVAADFRTYILLFGVFLSIGGYIGLPQRVKVIEDATSTLSHTVDKYIAVQQEKEEGRDKREELLVNLVLKLDRANNSGGD